MDYASLQATALRLLEEHGVEVSYTRKTAGTYNTATSTVTGATEATTTVHTVFTPAKGRGDAVQVARPAVVGQQWRVVFSATELGSVAPAPGDTVTRAGKVYTFLSVDPVQPAALPIVYFGTVSG